MQQSFNEASSVVARANLDDQQRLAKYQKAWTAYYGQHKKPLITKKGKPDDNLIINLIRLAVNVKVGFLFGEPGKEIAFSTDGDAGESTAQELWLKQFWAANRKLTKLQKIGLNGAVCGNTYVKLALPDVAGDYPRLIPQDPAIVTPHWDPDDIDRVLKWVIGYEAVDENGKAIQRRQLIEPDGNQWHITDQQRRLGKTSITNGAWRTMASTPWPYTWAPMHHCQNLVDPNVFWGLADIEEDVIGLNDGLNFVASNINRILRYHAHPKTWGKGFSPQQLKVGPDETLILESSDGSLHNLEMVSDLSSSIEFYETIRKALMVVTTVPEVALGGIDDASRVSSLALKVLYGPLLMQTGVKRITYGEMLSELNQHALELADRSWAGTLVSNVWPYMLPEDPMQEAQTALLDQQLGASQDTLLRQRGYNPETEAANKEEEGGNFGEKLLAQFDRGDDV